MSFVSRELSWHIGVPIELYTFEWGSNVKTYSSGGRDIVIDGTTYEAAYIARDDFELTNDSLKSDLSIHVPRDNYVAQQYVGWPPDDVVKVTLSCVHKGDSEVMPVWKGRVVAHTLSKDKATFTCESYYTALKRRGLRAQYSQLCRHMLYDDFCGLDRATWSPTYTNAWSHGNHVACADFSSVDNHWWSGGIITVVSTGEERFIIEHWEENIRIQYPFSSNIEGVSVVVCPGCNHMIETCQSKFGNHLNFGGFPHMITDNPFTGDKIM